MNIDIQYQTKPFFFSGDIEPGRVPTRATKPGRRRGREIDGRRRRRKATAGRDADVFRQRDRDRRTDGRGLGATEAPAQAFNERVGRGQRGRGRQRAVRRHLAIGPGVHAGHQDGQRGGDHIPGQDPRGRGVRHMHAGARIRRAVRHVRRFGDRVRRGGRVPVAQVPGEAGDAKDDVRPGPSAQRGRGRGRRRRLHPQLAGRHRGAEQADRVQNDSRRRRPDQTKQLIDYY